ACGAVLDQFVGYGEPPLGQLAAFVHQLALRGVVNGREQGGEGRSDRLARLTVLVRQAAVAGQRKTPRRALGGADQYFQIRDLLEHAYGPLSRRCITTRLGVEQDRRTADDQKDSEADSEDEPLRQDRVVIFP